MPYNDLRKGRWSEPGREYLVTTVTLHRHPVFDDFDCARTFIRQLAQLDKENVCTWLAWVLMPDHFHGLLRLDGRADLPAVMRYLKCRSGNAIDTSRGACGSRATMTERCAKRTIVWRRRATSSPTRCGPD